MRETTLQLYPEIKRLILEENKTTTQIAVIVGVSWPTILKLVRFKNEDDILAKLNKNNNYNKSKGLRKSLGHAKGKTYEELYGDRADEMRRKRSDWLKQNNIRKHATRVSKPQAQLYAIVKNDFEEAELEYEVKVNSKKSIWLDIAIPSKKINIEYDGLYWHTMNESTISMTDERRDNFLRGEGWTVYRIQSHQNLSEEELKTKYNKLKLM